MSAGELLNKSAEKHTANERQGLNERGPKPGNQQGLNKHEAKLKKRQMKSDKRKAKLQKKLIKKHEKAQKKAQKKNGIKVRRVARDRVFDHRGYTNKLTYDELLNAESALGRTIFGPIPEGHQREFFEYRKNVWIWHESFAGPHGAMQEMTVRYEVRPNGVFKRPGNGNYRKIEGVELDNFRKAARMYLELIKTRLYC